MSAGDWKDLYQATLDGNLVLVDYHISQGVNPLQAARKHGRSDLITTLTRLNAREPHQPFRWRWLPI